jgi:hypothetical protein
MIGGAVRGAPFFVDTAPGEGYKARCSTRLRMAGRVGDGTKPAG